MSKRYKLVLASILSVIAILLFILLGIYFKDVLAKRNDDYIISEDTSSGKEINVMYISCDLTNNFEHQSVMNLKSILKAYDNIVFKIYDSKGSFEVQSIYMDNAMENNSDVIIINPVDFDDALPQITSLHEADKPVILIGNHKISPYYKSIGYSYLHTGKLIAQSILNKVEYGSVSVISESIYKAVPSEAYKGISSELQKHEDIAIDKIISTKSLTAKDISLKIDELLSNEAIIILDTDNFESIYSLLIAKDYQGLILSVTQSYNHLAYIIDNKNLVLVLQESEQLNERLFDMLINVLNDIPENPHYQASQTVVNYDNIGEYIND